jgi:hypothetical protein
MVFSLATEFSILTGIEKQNTIKEKEPESSIREPRIFL